MLKTFNEIQDYAVTSGTTNTGNAVVEHLVFMRDPNKYKELCFYTIPITSKDEKEHDETREQKIVEAVEYYQNKGKDNLDVQSLVEKSFWHLDREELNKL